jgi:hypothetical protein
MNQQFFTLPQVATLLGSGGKKPSTCTVWRWCRHGCKGIKLGYVRFGRKIYITRESLNTFGAELAAVDQPLLTSNLPSLPKTISASQRAKEIAHAEEYLKKEGVVI